MSRAEQAAAMGSIPSSSDANEMAYACVGPVLDALEKIDNRLREAEDRVSQAHTRADRGATRLTDAERTIRELCDQVGRQAGRTEPALDLAALAEIVRAARGSA